MNKKTLVIGASEHIDRYSNQAVRLLNKFGHNVKALGVKNGWIETTEIEVERPQDDDFDTVTMYLNPQRQKDVEEYILSLNPNRIIFNPGTENPVFAREAQEKGIEVENACTLVLLRTHQY
ncbi:MAG TPA: CoA-binding protein [Chitinophagales bacterium]|nr:CoA-binding protein [Chitinophagales bacterium]